MLQADVCQPRTVEKLTKLEAKHQREPLSGRLPLLAILVQELLCRIPAQHIAWNRHNLSTAKSGYGLIVALDEDAPR